MLIRNQELVPADAELLSETANIDYAFVTGEALPVEKKKGDMIFAGGRQAGSSIRLKVLKSVVPLPFHYLWETKAGGTECWAG